MILVHIYMWGCRPEDDGYRNWSWANFNGNWLWRRHKLEFIENIFRLQSWTIVQHLPEHNRYLEHRNFSSYDDFEWKRECFHLNMHHGLIHKQMKFRNRNHERRSKMSKQIKVWSTVQKTTITVTFITFNKPQVVLTRNMMNSEWKKPQMDQHRFPVAYIRFLNCFASFSSGKHPKATLRISLSVVRCASDNRFPIIQEHPCTLAVTALVHFFPN